MPASFPNQLCGAPREAQNDLLEFRVFGLPDLKTVLEELLNIGIAWSEGGKLTLCRTDVPHPGQDKDPASFAHLVIAEQIPLTRNACQVPGFNRSFFIGFGVELLVFELYHLLVLNGLAHVCENLRIWQISVEMSKRDRGI